MVQIGRQSQGELRMRRKMFWRAGIVAAVTFGGCLGMSVGELGLLGVSPAEAKAYYTRKRVNGR